MPEDHTKPFGCDRCWPADADADAAWKAMLELRIALRLIDESHFTVKLRTCERCGQGFVTVFTETIDWQGGDDPQRWSVTPVTPDESIALQGAGGLMAMLHKLAPERRSLCHDSPKGEPPRNFWTQGIVIGPHD
ncbi:MAG: hypothetical protein SV108_04430 [Pseudomonadota bacterium]|nr:hypothetical protein [Pseudomonadota bacterium]